MTEPRDLIVAVVGPTASGKSGLALDLAGMLPGTLGASAPAELVGADAMQLYRGMDIGTAKTPPDERRGIPHHQVDVLDVTDEASVAAYQREARHDVGAIHGRGGVALVAGGSGLYLRALLDVIDFPGTDPGVRARLEAEAEGPGGPRGLHARLEVLDPDSAARIDPRNARRLVRALEVIELTGRPYSSHMPRREFQAPAVMIGVRRPWEELDRRIGARAAAMFRDGLVEETRGLIAAGLREGRTARRATGYAQALAVIDGEMGEDDAVGSVALATRQLARRQAKWFRPDPRIVWLEAGEGAGGADARGRALADRAVDVVRSAAEGLGSVGA
jgi:tRNA dimethylallyltransferase